MTDSSKIRRESLLQGAVVHLILDDPPANVIDRTLIQELDDELRAPRDPAVRLILISGAGSHFSFGASVPEHVKELAPELIPRFHEVVRLLVQQPTPTASLVLGRCLGGGLELAAACDFVFVEGGATLAVPEIKLGVLPPLASILLPWRIGAGRSYDMVLTGRSVSAEEAVALGLATQWIEPGRGLETVSSWVEDNLVPLSAASLGHCVRAMRQGLIERLGDPLERLEDLYLTELMQTHDANEGIQSFIEKRPPKWEHT